MLGVDQFERAEFFVVERGECLVGLVHIEVNLRAQRQHGADDRGIRIALFAQSRNSAFERLTGLVLETIELGICRSLLGRRLHGFEIGRPAGLVSPQLRRGRRGDSSGIFFSWASAFIKIALLDGKVQQRLSSFLGFWLIGPLLNNVVGDVLDLFGLKILIRLF